MEFVQMCEGPGGTRQPVQRSEGGIPIAKTANYAITESDLVAGNNSYNNRGAGGGVTFSLPVLTSKWNGVRLFFKRVTMQNVVIDAPTGTIIRDAAAATSDGGTLTDSTANDRGSLVLVYEHPDWIVESKSGTWAAA